MTNNPSESAEKVALPVETGTTLPSGGGFAANLRGFGPLGILAILVVLFSPTPLIGAVLVLVWVRWSHTPWHEIGYVRPKSWIGTLALGLAFGVAFKFLMKAIVMPLLGAPAVNPAYHYVTGNRAALVRMALAVIVGAGFGEETVFRGFMFERLGKLLGSNVVSKTSIVLLTAAWFALIHYPEQGFAGAEQAAITGLVFGAIFAVTGRIFVLMFGHAAFDLAAIALIYWNLESKVAHFIFR